MNILSLDIELNQLTTPKVIEIGAVVFKGQTGVLLDTFQTFVDPNELISEYITQLTSITSEQVAGAPSIADAYYMLKQFHKKHKCFMNPVLWGSGTRNDADTIWKESKVDEPNFMGFRVIDAKTLYQSLRMYQNSIVKGGLYIACEELGIEWDNTYGAPHKALPDAFNTYRVWHHLTKSLTKGVASGG